MRLLKRRCGITKHGLTRNTKGKNAAGGTLKAALATQSLDDMQSYGSGTPVKADNLGRLRDSLSKLRVTPSVSRPAAHGAKTKPRYISI